MKFIDKLPIFNKKIAWHVVDFNNKFTQYGKNSFEPMYPASAYKAFIIAAILHDDVSLDDKIKTMKQNRNNDLFPINSTTMNPDILCTVSNLLQKMMINSDNRAANTLAELTDVEMFIKDKKFEKSGKTNKFKSGKYTMYSDRIQSTASDMAMLGSYIEQYASESIKQHMYNFAVGGGSLKVSWGKSGSMISAPKLLPKYFGKIFERRFKTQMGVIQKDGLYYSFAILTQCNRFRGSKKEINFIKIQKQMEQSLCRK